MPNQGSFYTCEMTSPDGVREIIAKHIDPAQFHFWIDEIFGHIDLDAVPKEIVFRLENPDGDRLSEEV